MAVRPPFAFIRPLAFNVLAVINPLTEREAADIPPLAVKRALKVFAPVNVCAETSYITLAFAPGSGRVTVHDAVAGVVALRVREKSPLKKVN